MTFKYWLKQIARISLALIVMLAMTESQSHAEPKMTDQLIADHVEDELLFDSVVFSSNIDTVCEDGIVTLSGSVDNLLAKERAARLSETVRGVKSVVNLIDVQAVDQRKADQIRADIISALAVDAATDSYEIDINVNRDGKVTLSGKVESWQEKQLAAKTAKSVRGVTQLENQISVNYTRDRSDTEIAAEIRKALEWSVFVNYPSMIEVEVDDGEVTLSGIVSSPAEKNRAITYGWVNGVSDVNTSDLIVSQSLEQPNNRNDQPDEPTDREIKQAVLNALFYDPRVNSFNVDIDATYGRITLRGEVDNLESKRSAEQTTRNTRGVTTVYNRLKVRSENQLTDNQLEKKARKAIAGDSWIADDDVTLLIENGVADIFGTVDSTYEKNKAESLVSAIEGISYVDNNITAEDNDTPYVYDPYLDEYDPYTYTWYYQESSDDLGQHYSRYNNRLSDADIKREINDELWWSPFVDSDDVNVSVKNARATLTGTVSSMSEKQSAAENAIEGGATSVENKLTIQ